MGVHVFQSRPNRPADPYPLSLPDYFEYGDRAKSFDALAGHYPTSPMHVIVDGEPVAINGAVVTASYFDVLQLRAARGRFFAVNEDEARDRDAAAVVSYGFWRRRLGGKDDAVGSRIQINGRPFTIVGVAPRGCTGVHARGGETEAWTPSAMFTNGYRYCDAFTRGCNIIELIGRLKPDTSMAAARNGTGRDRSRTAASLSRDEQGPRRERGRRTRPGPGHRHG